MTPTRTPVSFFISVQFSSEVRIMHSFTTRVDGNSVFCHSVIRSPYRVCLVRRPAPLGDAGRRRLPRRHRDHHVLRPDHQVSPAPGPAVAVMKWPVGFASRYFVSCNRTPWLTSSKLSPHLQQDTYDFNEIVKWPTSQEATFTPLGSLLCVHQWISCAGTEPKDIGIRIPWRLNLPLTVCAVCATLFPS